VLRTEIFWNVTPCRLLTDVSKDRSTFILKVKQFKRTWTSFVVPSVQVLTLNIKAARFSETSVYLKFYME